MKYDLSALAAELRPIIDEVGITVDSDGQIPELHIHQAMTQNPPEGSAYGMFYSRTTAWTPREKFYAVIVNTTDVKTLLTREIGSSAHVICACQNFNTPIMTGVGEEYVKQGERYVVDPKATFACETCAKNRFRNPRAAVTPREFPADAAEYCKSGKVFGLLLVEDVTQITPETVIPAKMVCSAGVFASGYKKFRGVNKAKEEVLSWKTYADMLTAGGVRWDALITEISTLEFRTDGKPAFQPVFRPVLDVDAAKGKAVYTPTQEILKTYVGDKLAVGAGRGLLALEEGDTEYVPAFTGKQA